MVLTRVLGIRIRVSCYFILVLAAFFVAGAPLSILTYFFVIASHELAHVVFAAGFGLRVEELELLPFGSVARIPQLVAAPPSVETSIALAGPLHNLLLLALGLVVERALNGAPVGVLQTFIEANLVLGLFNLVPVLPLDGGRVLRAQLAAREGYAQATRMLAMSGRLLGILMLVGTLAALLIRGLVALTPAILGGFLWYAASQESINPEQSPVYRVLRRRKQLRQTGVLSTRSIVVHKDVRIEEVLRELVGENYHLVWVVDPKTGIVGRLGEGELVGKLEEGRTTETIGELL